MAWYSASNPAASSLDLLLNSNPSLSDLLLHNPPLVELLTTYQPRLLAYMTERQDLLLNELIILLADAPLLSDSEERKHKLPAAARALIHQDSPQLLDWLAQRTIEVDGTRLPALVAYTCKLIEQAESKGELLPLLAGYYSQIFSILWFRRGARAVQVIYSHPKTLQLLLRHAKNRAIAQVLHRCLLYPEEVAIAVEKNATIIAQVNGKPQNVIIAKIARKDTKLQFIAKIISLIRDLVESTYEPHAESILRLEHTVPILIDVIEHTNRLSDGREMLDLLMLVPHINLFLQGAFKHSSRDLRLLLLKWVTSTLKQYVVCVLNPDSKQIGSQVELQRFMNELENHHFIKALLDLFPYVAKETFSKAALSLEDYYRVDLMNTCLSLNTLKVLAAVKEVSYFRQLLNLVVKNPSLSILHQSVQQLFNSIATKPKWIHILYLHHMICDLDIISLSYELCFHATKAFQSGPPYKLPPYLGTLVNIIFSYSSFESINNQGENMQSLIYFQDYVKQILENIRSRIDKWQMLQKDILIPYKKILTPQLGSLDVNILPVLVVFKTKLIAGASGAFISVENQSRAAEEVVREETIKNLQSLKNTNLDIYSTEAKSIYDSDASASQDNQGVVAPNTHSTMSGLQTLSGLETVRATIIKPSLPQSPPGSSENISPSKYEQPTPIEISTPQRKAALQKATPITASNPSPSPSPAQVPDEAPQQPKILKKADSYKDFIANQKIVVGQTLKLQRSSSQDKSLTSRGRISSSPKKKAGNWGESATPTGGDSGDKYFKAAGASFHAASEDASAQGLSSSAGNPYKRGTDLIHGQGNATMGSMSVAPHPAQNKAPPLPHPALKMHNRPNQLNLELIDTSQSANNQPLKFSNSPSLKLVSQSSEGLDSKHNTPAEGITIKATTTSVIQTPRKEQKYLYLTKDQKVFINIDTPKTEATMFRKINSKDRQFFQKVGIFI